MLLNIDSDGFHLSYKKHASEPSVKAVKPSADTLQCVCERRQNMSAISVDPNLEIDHSRQMRMRLDQVLLEQSTLLFQAVGTDMDKVIQDTIGKIGSLFGVARVYVFRVNETEATMDNTQEWCASGIEPQIALLQGLPLSRFPQWIHQLRSNREILIPDVASLPETWRAEREILEMQSIASVLVLPIGTTGRLRGFAGFDAVTPGFCWPVESRQMLQHFANNIGTVWANMETRKGMLEAMHLASELAQKEQTASRQKSAFLSNMSHEIRTPMNAVIGLAYLLLDTPLTALQRRYVEGIRMSGGTVTKIINYTLDLSRIESGQTEVHIAPFRISTLVRELEAAFSFQAVAKGLEAAFSVDSGVPDTLLGDATRISQILNNLLANAIKFSRRGTVRLRISLLEKTADQCVLNLVVSDEGIGMSDEDIERIFQPYWQSRASLRAEHAGSDLGLAISRQLAELIGGSIAVESRPGVGSTFTLKLPIALSLPEIGPDPESDDAARWQPGYEARLLVAEDIEINREIVRSLLNGMGMAADLAIDGAKALQMVQENDYDAVLMDVQMPVMDGLEATRRIRQLGGRFAGLPIIALTAHALREDQQGCIDAGMNDLIIKPVDPAYLAKVLSRWLPFDTSARNVEPETGMLLTVRESEDDRRRVFDPREGLKLTGGDIDAYENVLRRYIAQFEHLPAQLQDRLLTSDKESLRNMLHYLGSVSSLIGSRLIQEQVNVLEDTLQKPAGFTSRIQTQEQLDHLVACIDRVIRRIRRHLYARHQHAPA